MRCPIFAAIPSYSLDNDPDGTSGEMGGNQMNDRAGKRLVNALAAIVAAAITMSAGGAEQLPDSNKIFEYDLTGSLAIYSGNPEIALDPENPRHLATIEDAHGAHEFPIYQLGSGIAEYHRDLASPYGGLHGDISISSDGGNTWTKLPRPNPAARPPVSTTPFFRRSNDDPFIAFGPHGVLYEGVDVEALYQERPGYASDSPDGEPTLAASSDLGKTWTAPHEMHTPFDRPWITADQSTGKLYSVSTGALNLAERTHNIPGPNAIVDRWLVAYQPMLTKQTEPRRLGGPDFAVSAANSIAAAHGIIAATFAILPSAPAGPQRQGTDPHVILNGRYIPPPTEADTAMERRTSSAIPDSLRSVVPAQITECTLALPCLFLETSKDDGLHWTRHYVPVPGGFFAAIVSTAFLAVDAGHPGRYAIAVLSPDRTRVLVMVSDDSGANWSAPAQIAETAAGIDFKPRLAYGPTGVLGFFWRKQRDDVPPPDTTIAPSAANPYGNGSQYGFDVYDDISCDGGFHWGTPVRVNAVTSPGSNAAQSNLGLDAHGSHDQVSDLALDAHFSHMVWGDRRVLPQVQSLMVPGAVAGTHVFYGRVPFAVISGGAKCGR
jgi:hypothetical protein